MKIRDLFYSLFPQRKNYLVYHIGNSPIILSAPHSGNLKPITIPNRTWGNRSKDTYTYELIRSIIELSNTKPYYIYSNIHRSKVDLNRQFREATQGSKKAEIIWTEWNKTLYEFTKDVRNKYGKGLYIDIHSHNNSSMFEIGYGLKVKDYLSAINGEKVARKSTMSSLRIDKDSEYNTLFGSSSFPVLLESFGHKVLVPKSDDDYLNGGYNIKKFDENGIGAIQIECPIPILKYKLDKVAQDLVKIISIFQSKFLV